MRTVPKQRSRLDRLARVPWGTITLSMLATPGALELIGAVTGTRAFLAELMAQAMGVFVLAMLAVIAIGSVVRGVAPPPRPAFDVPGALRFSVRQATNPFAIGYVSFLTFVCPVSIAVLPLMPAVETAQLAHFGITMLVLSLVTGAVGWLFRPLAIASTRDALVVQEKLGATTYEWSTVAAVEADAKSNFLIVREHVGMQTRIACTAIAAADLPGLAAHLDALAKATTKSIPREPADADGARWAVLDRNGRSLRQWRADLRTLAGGDEGYRAAPVTIADLFTVLGDARVSTERRLAAAMALRDSGSPDATQQIRVAIDAAGERRTRVALERIVDDSMDERALKRSLAADRPVSQRRRHWPWRR